MHANLEALYRQLSEFSPVEAESSDLPHDARRIGDWVAALPRANLQAVQAQLSGGLAALAARSMDGPARLTVLEQLRQPVHEVILQLGDQYLGASFPLAAAKVAAAQDAQALHALLADGYRQAAVELCAPAGKVPMLRGGSVAMALARSLQHYGGALREAWHVYRAPRAGVWRGMHGCFAFAEAARLEGKRVEDDLVGQGGSPQGLYLRALLAATIGPYAFNQASQGAIWALAAAYAEQCRLVPYASGSARPIVRAHDDLPPEGYDQHQTARLQVDLAALQGALDAALERQAGDSVLLSPSRKEQLPFARETLERVRRALKLGTERAWPRVGGGHALDSVIGLSSLHHHLAGGRGFESFLRHAREHQIVLSDRAAWAHASAESVSVRRIPAQVLDQSLGGYRLHWGAEARARVGELVGLCLPSEAVEDWMVGVIRWIRYEDDGGIMAGVELLARRARAAALVGREAVGGERPPLRAIELDRPDGLGGGAFVALARAEEVAGEFEVLRMPAAEGAMPLRAPVPPRTRLGIVQNPGEYALLAAPVPGSESNHE